MMKGSNGIGGRRYQIAAVLLTYAAVSLAAIPMSISQYAAQQKAHRQGLAQRSSPPVVASDPSQDPADAATPEQVPATSQPKPGVGAALAMLAIIGLTSPFLALQDPVHGVLGLIILSVGIRIAWKLTAGTPVDILGPFAKSAPAKADTSA